MTTRGDVPDMFPNEHIPSSEEENYKGLTEILYLPLPKKKKVTGKIIFLL